MSLLCRKLFLLMILKMGSAANQLRIECEKEIKIDAWYLVQNTPECLWYSCAISPLRKHLYLGHVDPKHIPLCSTLPKTDAPADVQNVFRISATLRIRIRSKNIYSFIYPSIDSLIYHLYTKRFVIQVKDTECVYNTSCL